MKGFFNKLMSRIDLGCEEISRTSSASFDRPLTFKERRTLFLHLLMCGFCRRYHRQLKALHLISSDLGAEKESEPQQSTPEMPKATRRRLQEKIQKATKK